VIFALKEVSISTLFSSSSLSSCSFVIIIILSYITYSKLVARF
jgi:hypothetical protein